MRLSDPATTGTSLRHPDLRKALWSFWARARSPALWFSFRSGKQLETGSMGDGVDVGSDVIVDRRSEHADPGKLLGDAVSVRRELYELASGAMSLTYLIDMPYDKALKQLRVALKAEGLQIPVEMDVSDRIRHELGVDLRPCFVLCIDCPFLLLEAAIINTSAAALLPLQLVVAEAGLQSVIHLVPRTDGAATASLRVQFENFLGRVLGVLRGLGAQRAVRELVS